MPLVTRGARYADDSREKVREAVDFIQLVSARTELRKAGVNRYTGRCPFHDERTPSFGIDPTEKLYHCFGCGAGGDVFTFVMETENLGFVEALEVLADRFGVQLEREEEDPLAAQRREARERLWKLLERTAAYYVRVLWESPEAANAREYLASRGLDEQVCRQFRVGYSPNSWDRVVVGSTRAGFTEGELLAAGIATKTPRGVFDRFRGRLMFPFATVRGRVLGFGARALREDDKPKYLNSAENEVYSKGELLFALDVARVGAAKSGSVVLAEGYTDVLALHQAGITSAVGSMGTSLTDKQAQALVSAAPSVILCMDADRAGQTAMVKAERAIAKATTDHAQPEVVRVVQLPPKTDPADIVARGGAEELRQWLDQAVPFPQFLVDRYLDNGDLNSSSGRDRVLQEVRSVIAPLPRSVLRDELVRLVAGKLALTEGLAAAALGDGGAAAITLARTGNGNGSPLPKSTLNHRDETERAFLGLCIALPAPGREKLDESLFSTELLQRAAAYLRENLEAPSSGLANAEADLTSLIAELVVRAGSVENPTVAELERAELHLRVDSLGRQLAEARRTDSEDLHEIAMHYQAVRAELQKRTF